MNMLLIYKCKYSKVKEPIETHEKIFQGTIILQINVFSSFERKNKNTIKSEKGTIEQTQTIFKNFQL